MENGNDLYRRFLEGDELAFESLVMRYKNNLINFIFRYVRNADTAEDIAQDSFVELLVHRHRFNFKTSVKTYLFTIAKNKALNFLKKQKRHPQTDISSCEYFLISAENTEDGIIKRERAEALKKCLGKIPDDYAEALYLAYIEGLSVSDTAKVMNKNKKQTENLIFRGKAAARAELIKEGISLED